MCVVIMLTRANKSFVEFKQVSGLFWFFRSKKKANGIGNPINYYSQSEMRILLEILRLAFSIDAVRWLCGQAKWNQIYIFSLSYSVCVCVRSCQQQIAREVTNIIFHLFGLLCSFSRMMMKAQGKIKNSI